MYGSSKQPQPNTLVWGPVLSYPAISWVTFKMKSRKICCQTLALFHHLQPGRSKSQHSTVRPNIFGNLHPHYTPITPQQHASQSMTKLCILLASVMWWINTVYACLARVILLDITIEHLHTPAVVRSDPHPFPPAHPARKQERGATLSGRSEMNTLTGVDRALWGDYMRQKKHRTHSLICSWE